MARSSKCSGLTLVLDLTSASRHLPFGRRSRISALMRTRSNANAASKIAGTARSAIKCRVCSTASACPSSTRTPPGTSSLAAAPTSVPTASIVPGSASDLGSGSCQPSQSRFGHWSPVMYLDFDNRGWERVSNNSTRLNCPDQLGRPAAVNRRVQSMRIKVRSKWERSLSTLLRRPGCPAPMAEMGGVRPFDNRILNGRCPPN